MNTPLRDRFGWAIMTFVMDHIVTKAYKDRLENVIGFGMHYKYGAKYNGKYWTK